MLAGGKICILAHSRKVLRTILQILATLDFACNRKFWKCIWCEALSAFGPKCKSCHPPTSNEHFDLNHLVLMPFHIPLDLSFSTLLANTGTPTQSYFWLQISRFRKVIARHFSEFGVACAPQSQTKKCRGCKALFAFGPKCKKWSAQIAGFNFVLEFWVPEFFHCHPDPCF